MTTSMSSPGLGSASLMEWPGVISPDTGAPRLVQKQVVRVKATGSEALVVLYLRLTVRPSAIMQTFQLFPDEGVTLKSSQVYPVDMSKEGRAVIPPEASRHLQRAAEILTIKRATMTSSPLYQEVHSSSRMKKAKITTSNFHVSFVVPPEANRLTSQKGESRRHYVAVVQLAIPFILTPPKWPYMVRIPLARCLNNFLNFSVDESCVQDNTVVEVDPPLLPKPTPITGTKGEVTEAEADEDQRLSGPFYSTSSLCIRWASADAGITRNSHSLVQAHSMHVSATFSQFKRTNGTVAEMLMQAQLTFKDVHYPGLNPTANIQLHLEAPSGSYWRPETVSIVPSRQSASSFRSFSGSGPASTAILPIASGSIIRSRSQQIRSPSPISTSSASSDEVPEADLTLDDEGNLLDVRPPKGITSAELNSSSDKDSIGDDTMATRRSNGRRSSLGQQLPNGTASVLEAKSDLIPGKERTLFVTLSVAALCQNASKDFVCSLEAVILVPIDQEQDKAELTRVTLPLIRANGIASEMQATILGATIDQFASGKDVRVDGMDTECFLGLPAFPSTAEIQGADIKILVGAVKPNGSILEREAQEASPGTVLEEDSDDLSIGKSFRRNIGAGQTSQIDSLSGMIQEASVEVYSAAALQEDLLLAEGAKRIKTTHVIRSSWPSAPASHSSNCGADFLPQVVFALPCSDESELQVLSASINGRSVHVEENAGSNMRIIDLKLPDSFKKAAKVDLFLLYTQQLSSIDNLCLFPPVASSIAELTVTLQHGAFDFQMLPISFTNQPVNISEEHTQKGALTKIRAHMVPSMTSVSAVLVAKAGPSLHALTPSGDGPLRRTLDRRKKRIHRYYLPSAGYLLHAVCTAILAIVLLGTIINLKPIGTLSRKVDSLAMALNVDFSDGSWKPESISSVSTTQILPESAIWKEKKEIDLTPKDHIINYVPDEHGDELHELSVDIKSYAMLMRHLSLGFTRSLLWPLHFFFALFGQSPPS